MKVNHQRAALQRILDACVRRWEFLTRYCGCGPDNNEVKNLEKVIRIARGGLKRGERTPNRRAKCGTRSDTTSSGCS